MWVRVSAVAETLIIASSRKIAGPDVMSCTRSTLTSL